MTDVSNYTGDLSCYVLDLLFDNLMHKSDLKVDDRKKCRYALNNHSQDQQSIIKA